MYRNLKFLLENYSSLKPLYFGRPEQKDLWFEWLADHKHAINSDGSVDIHENVKVTGHSCEKRYKSLFPMSVLPFKFNVVQGDFIANSNELESLVNFPKRVEGKLHIPAVGPLMDLEGCPEYVGGDFSFYNDTGLVKDLVGCPKYIGGDVYMQGGNITSLKGCPEVIYGKLDAGYSQLKTLEGSPKIVHGDFKVHYTQIKSLEGSPKTVGGDFACGFNSDIISLKGAPLEIKGEFRGNNFSDADYRKYVKKIALVDNALSKDFDIKALEDFE